MKTRRLFLMSLASGMAVIGLTVQSASAAPPGNDNLSETRHGSGSDTTYTVDQLISDLYGGSPGCNLDQSSTDGTPFANFRGCSPVPGSQNNTVQSENYDHDVIAQDYPVGSSKGISLLCTQIQPNRPQVDYARASRDAQPSDCAGLSFNGFAKDGVSVEVFRNTAVSAAPGALQGSPAAGCDVGEAPKSIGGSGCTGTPVSDLTTQNIRDLWVNCSLRDWRQLTKPNTFVLPTNYDPTAPNSEPIIVWTAQDGSGTRNTFEQFLGGGPTAPSTPCIFNATETSNANYPNVLSNIIFENNALPIAARTKIQLANAAPVVPGPAVGGSGSVLPDRVVSESIFFFSHGLFSTQGFSTAGGLELTVNGVQPSARSEVQGTYPITRNLWHVVPTPGGPLFNAIKAAFPSRDLGGIQDFVHWICTAPATHVSNPFSGNNYFDDVSSALATNGFPREPAQPDGTRCITQTT
ncbi:MAG: type 2 periplasmic-binding domain-containing protein [Acidimicrobiales bacterium]